MKKYILTLLLFAISTAGFSKVWTITNSGNTFTPATLTISAGDTVNFDITSMHNAVEVSKATWDANGTTALPGFSVPFGGGMVYPEDLGVGSHYYVCTAHASLGMKGTIVVENSSAISDVPWMRNFSVFPNPSNGHFQVDFSESLFPKNCYFAIYNLTGVKEYEVNITGPRTDFDLSYLAKGLYIMKVYNKNAVLTKRIIFK